MYEHARSTRLEIDTEDTALSLQAKNFKHKFDFNIVSKNIRFRTKWL